MFCFEMKDFNSIIESISLQGQIVNACLVGLM